MDKLKELREELSNLEHEQWMKWSGTLNERFGNWAELIARGKANVVDVVELITEQHERWKKNWKPYAELDEKTKDFDREWADKVLKVFASWLEGKRKELKESIGKSFNVKTDYNNRIHYNDAVAIMEKWVDAVLGCGSEKEGSVEASGTGNDSTEDQSILPLKAQEPKGKGK